MAGRKLLEKYSMPSGESKLLAVFFVAASPVFCIFFMEKKCVLQSHFFFFSLSQCLFSNLELPIVYEIAIFTVTIWISS